MVTDVFRFWFVQDKWRNIHVTAIWGSRQKAKLALKRDPATPKHDSNSPLAASTFCQSDKETIYMKPPTSDGPLHSANCREPTARSFLI